MEEDIAKSKSPLKEMPECWQNNIRMNALFAPFRKREVNPLDWDSKMTFWKRNINMWCNDNNCCTFTILQLQQVFQRNGRISLCLGNVVEDMLRNGEIMMQSDFLKTIPSQNQSWASWTVNNVVKTPVTWAFEKLKNSLISPSVINFEARFVHLAMIKKNGEKIVEAMKGQQQELVTLDRIKELLEIESEEVVEMTIHWLQLKDFIHVAKHDNTVLVKVITSKNNRKYISEADLAVFSLQQNERRLMKNLEELELQKQNTEQEARNYLRKGMRQMAKSCLRKKKALEKCIDKRASALENVQLLLNRIQEAESDSKVLDSYKMGLSAMKSTFKEAGLTEDGVSNTMNQVQEVLDFHDEIQASLAEPVGENIDADLESELAELINSMPSPTSKDLDIDLPEAPSSLPQPPSEAKVDQTKVQRQKTAI